MKANVGDSNTNTKTIDKNNEMMIAIVCVDIFLFAFAGRLSHLNHKTPQHQHLPPTSTQYCIKERKS